MPATGSRKTCGSHRGARKTGARKTTTGARKTCSSYRGARKTTCTTGSQKFTLSQLKNMYDKNKKNLNKIKKFVKDHDKDIDKGIQTVKQLSRRRKKN